MPIQTSIKVNKFIYKANFLGYNYNLILLCIFVRALPYQIIWQRPHFTHLANTDPGSYRVCFVPQRLAQHLQNKQSPWEIIRDK